MDRSDPNWFNLMLFDLAFEWNEYKTRKRHGQGERQGERQEGRSSDQLKPQNPDQGHPQRKEAENLSNLSEVRELLVWVGVSG